MNQKAKFKNSKIERKNKIKRVNNFQKDTRSQTIKKRTIKENKWLLSVSDLARNIIIFNLCYEYFSPFWLLSTLKQEGSVLYFVSRMCPATLKLQIENKTIPFNKKKK